MPMHRNINKNFFKKWTPEMAYVLGFFAADGVITISKRGAYYFGFHVADKSLIYTIRKVMSSNHTISKRIPKNKNHSTLYRLQIGNKDMCKDLQKLGFGEGKTYNLSLPNVPKKYLGDFVRGYFDGDGNIWSGLINKHRKTPSYILQTAFTSCSQDFLQSLQNELTQFSLGQGCLYKVKNKNCYRLQYGVKDSQKLYSLMYNNGNLKSDLILQRKKIIFYKYFVEQNRK